MFGYDLSMLVAIVGAIVVKLFSSPAITLLRAIGLVIAAFVSALVFTDPVVHFYDLDPDIYQVPIAVTLALTGEGILRFLISVADDPKRAIELFRIWRGGK